MRKITLTIEEKNLSLILSVDEEEIVRDEWVDENNLLEEFFSETDAASRKRISFCA